LIRTALYNWAFARHAGGTFVLRIEDTDSARDTEQSYRDLLAALRWLGLDWDEGPEVGGPHGPYRQSERRGIYAEVAGKLLAAGYAYESFATPEETEARHRAAGRDPKLGYDNHDRDLTEADRARYRAEGRTPVLRLRMPDADVVWTDLVRDEIRFGAGTVADYVIVRSTGEPLYALTNPVDDALMGITHVLRGEDLLPSTPRQLALWSALTELGVAARTPRFGHLPYVLGEGNRKLSKRDPQSSLDHYRDQGYLPEGLLNYLALLGWSIAEDRDVFTLAEMIEAFDIGRVSANPARFDPQKCEAINATHLRLLAPEEFAARVLPFLIGAGLVADPPTEAQSRLLTAAAPLVQQRVRVLTEAVGMLAFLFADESDFTVDPTAAAKVLGPAAEPVLTASVDALAATAAWDAATIEGCLKGALVEGLGRKPKQAFAPVRVAISGRTVSPPLYESMELLGRERSLARLRAAAGRSSGA
jgi:glutamyl-tRNA synthetase